MLHLVGSSILLYILQSLSREQNVEGLFFFSRQFSSRHIHNIFGNNYDVPQEGGCYWQTRAHRGSWIYSRASRVSVRQRPSAPLGGTPLFRGHWKINLYFRFFFVKRNLYENLSIALSIPWLPWLHSLTTLTSFLDYPDWGFPMLFLGCKANARVKLAKSGHGPHLFRIIVFFVVLVIVLCYCLYAVLLLCCKVIVLLCYYLCCPMYWLCVLYHCHRVLTQLQLTNISIYQYINISIYQYKGRFASPTLILRRKGCPAMDFP